MDERELWRLIARHCTGTATASEEATLRTLTRDPAQAAVLRDAERLWAAAERPSPSGHWDVDAAWRRMAARIAADEAEPTELRDRAAPPGRPMLVRAGGGDGVPAGIDAARPRAVGVTRRRRWPLATAAVLAASAAGLLLARGGGTPPVEPAAMVQVTTADEPQSMQLSDGTLVRLGAASRLVEVSPRRVQLHGVAFFAVVPDSARPFEVALPAGAVRVLGTRFEVRATEDSTQVTVVEGRVAVNGARAAVELDAGERTVLARGGDPAAPSAAGLDSVARWMGRTLVFQGTPLSTAAAEIEAMYGVRVRVAPALHARTVTALFTDEPVERLVPTLCRAVQASCTTSDSLVIVEAQR